MGKYISLTDLKAYGSVDVTFTDDDTTLNQSISRAEMEVDAYCGQGFDEQTFTLTPVRQPFVDAYGWLWLSAIERAPVTAVTAVQIRALASTVSPWQTLSWGTDDIIMPLVTAPPDPNSGKVRIYPTNPRLTPFSTGMLLAKWSYKGGYNSIPDSLKGIVTRLAWWVYKLREAPLGRVATMELGIMEIPLSMPKDIIADLNLWRRMTT